MRRYRDRGLWLLFGASLLAAPLASHTANADTRASKERKQIGKIAHVPVYDTSPPIALVRAEPDDATVDTERAENAAHRYHRKNRRRIHALHERHAGHKLPAHAATVRFRVSIDPKTETFYFSASTFEPLGWAATVQYAVKKPYGHVRAVYLTRLYLGE